MAGEAESIYEQRFLSFIRVCLHRHAAHWKQRQKRLLDRELVILNVSAEGETTPFSYVVPKCQSAEEEYFREVSSLDDLLVHRNIWERWCALTPRQKDILTRLVLNAEKQHLVAQRLGISQQAVNRAKAQALRRLKS